MIAYNMKENYYIYKFKIRENKEDYPLIFNIAIEKKLESDTKEMLEENAIALAKKMVFAESMFKTHDPYADSLFILRETPGHPLLKAKWELISTKDVETTMDYSIKYIRREIK